MSFQTPDGWAQRCTWRNDYAMHQIRILMAPPYIAIDCTCAPNRHLALIEPGEDALQAWRDADHQPQAAAS